MNICMILYTMYELMEVVYKRHINNALPNILINNFIKKKIINFYKILLIKLMNKY